MNAVTPGALAILADRLAGSARATPPAVYDSRIDAPGEAADPALDLFVKHQALMRCYQARYVLLPSMAPAGGLLGPLQRHYDPARLQALDAIRPDLEAELIAPLAGEGAGADAASYVAAMLAAIRGADQNPFTAWLATTEHRDDHYRNFLVQSSPDLLAEASASALGVVGEFGEPQSALFRILIDEFGYGAHGKKHSVLYRAAMRGFGLDDEYNGYWPLFDTEALRLHNVIHWLFQNPRNLFRQIGFLLYAEAAYQRSTQSHYRHLSRFNPQVDARYFGEHAHIDLHHSRMVIDEVVTPLVAKFGEAVAAEVIVGAELTRTAFARAGDHLLGVSRAFEAVDNVSWGLAGDVRDPLGRPVTPASDLKALAGARVQVGAIGVLHDARDLAGFPPATIGRVLP
ncbi:MAG: hypothetical protein JWQ29_278 [Phenylobacterium sp.]|nr:hypothetical protein [Phenylobacterium sp.]